MGTRTVRLDDDAEQTLDRLRRMTGLSISEVLKRGLSAYEAQALGHANRKPSRCSHDLDAARDERLTSATGLKVTVPGTLSPEGA